MYESIATAFGESLMINVALGFASCYIFPLNSHLELYISYILVVVLSVIHNYSVDLATIYLAKPSKMRDKTSTAARKVDILISKKQVLKYYTTSIIIFLIR